MKDIHKRKPSKARGLDGVHIEMLQVTRSTNASYWRHGGKRLGGQAFSRVSGKRVVLARIQKGQADGHSEVPSSMSAVA